MLTNCHRHSILYSMRQISQQNLVNRAICQFSSWLDAVDIPNRKFKTHIMVQSKNDSSFYIYISQSTYKDTNRFYICGKDFISNDINLSLNIFNQITNSLGYGYPIPINRGEIDKRLSYKDNHESIIFRHCEFKKVPNHKINKIKEYQKIIDMASWHFLRNNYRFCALNGLEIEDLKSYSTVWAYNYIGLYEIAEPEYETENLKKMFAYIKQRFLLLKVMKNKKGKNCYPDRESVLAYCYDNDIETFEIDENDIEKDVIEPKKTNTLQTRKLKAKRLLEDNLYSLPHDQMVSLLKDSMDNESFDKSTKRLANKYLIKHTEKCNDCSRSD